MLARPDLADERLEGLVRADRFAHAQRMVCRASVGAIRKAPAPDEPLEDQLLYGEAFDVLATTEGWAWGQARRDGYVGFVSADDLGPAPAAPTHWVKVLRTLGFSTDDLKSVPVMALSMNSLVQVTGEANGLLDCGDAGFIPAEHLTAVGEFERDPAAVAERFVGAPYLWGGRGSLGLDCSGLIQQALYACGRGCPRDTDQQLAAFDQPSDPAALKRDDLVFWRGHVAMLLDGARIVHANAHHMAVAVEDLNDAVARIRAAGGGDPTAYRRP
jgi:hypothetical protein